MKSLLLITLAATFVSCATQTPQVKEYSVELNCSPRARERLAKSQDQVEVDASQREKEILEIRTEVRKAIPAAVQCYQAELDQLGADATPRKVCVVLSTSKEGNLDFIDVEDNTNPLPAKLKNCMIDAFSKVDVRKIKNATINQPVNLRPKKL